MAEKTYFCREFPSLTIAGICKFENNEYKTASITVQSKIEQSQSFTSGCVRLVEQDDEVEIQTVDVSPGDLVKMKKLELQEVADALGIDFGPEATRPDLISLISAQLRRE